MKVVMLTIYKIVGISAKSNPFKDGDGKQHCREKLEKSSFQRGYNWAWESMDFCSAHYVDIENSNHCKLDTSFW